MGTGSRDLNALKNQAESRLSALLSLQKSRGTRPTSWPALKPISESSLKPADYASLIDHTLLKPDATENQFKKLCEEARQHSFYSVCVPPAWVSACRAWLEGTKVRTITVVGFPLGANLSTTKAFEARELVERGAQEIDMVLAISLLKSGEDERVLEDMRAVVDAVTPFPVKVILETCLLTDEEKAIACLLSQAAGVAFVKTSTGFSTSGANAADVSLMRALVGEKVGVKASGGVRNLTQAREMVLAGANRLGTSASVDIVTQNAGSTGGY